MIKLSEDEQWLYRPEDQNPIRVVDIRLATTNDNKYFKQKDNNVTFSEGDRIITAMRDETLFHPLYYRIDFNGNIEPVRTTKSWENKIYRLRHQQKKYSAEGLPIPPKLLHPSLNDLRPRAENVSQRNAPTESNHANIQTDQSDFDDVLALFYPNNGEDNEQKIFDRLFSPPPINTDAPTTMQQHQPPTKRMRTSTATPRTESNQETQSQIQELNAEALAKQVTLAIMIENLETLTKAAEKEMIEKQKEIAEARHKADLEIQSINASVEEAKKNANLLAEKIINKAKEQAKKIIANAKQQINPEPENVAIAEEKSSSFPKHSINAQDHVVDRIKFSRDLSTMISFFDQVLASNSCDWQHLDMRYKKYFRGLAVKHQGKTYQATGLELYTYFSHSAKYIKLDAMLEVWNNNRETLKTMIFMFLESEQIKLFQSILSLNIKINNQATFSPKLKEQSETFIFDFFSAIGKKDTKTLYICHQWLATLPEGETTQILLGKVISRLNENQESPYFTFQPTTPPSQNITTQQYSTASALANLGLLGRQDRPQHSENLSSHTDMSLVDWFGFVK